MWKQTILREGVGNHNCNGTFCSPNVWNTSLSSLTSSFIWKTNSKPHLSKQWHIIDYVIVNLKIEKKFSSPRQWQVQMTAGQTIGLFVLAFPTSLTKSDRRWRNSFKGRLTSSCFRSGGVGKLSTVLSSISQNCPFLWCKGELGRTEISHHPKLWINQWLQEQKTTGLFWWK